MKGKSVVNERMAVVGCSVIGVEPDSRPPEVRGNVLMCLWPLLLSLCVVALLWSANERKGVRANKSWREMQFGLQWHMTELESAAVTTIFQTQRKASQELSQNEFPQKLISPVII